ncbi:MAG: hypothetical protein GX946_12360 [Oligosphaeraceae bacterium]|nr:hypothetical protein [Oligosphaeraceae bacterium]
MIPSDHFVRFYNEVFKYLEQHGGLEEYFQAIAQKQEKFCLETFKNDGLNGVHEYYQKIRHEENCGLDLNLTQNYLQLNMHACPSLAKAMDNDAGASLRYCDHCSWLMLLCSKAGLYIIYDFMDPKQPQCQSWIFDKLEQAKIKLKELQQKRGDATIKCNF